MATILEEHASIITFCLYVWYESHTLSANIVSWLNLSAVCRQSQKNGDSILFIKFYWFKVILLK